MNSKRILLVVLFVALLSLAVVFPWVSRARATQGPFNLVAWDSGNYVQLSWDAEPGANVQGYNVYRSVKGPENWEKLNQAPFLLTTFVDYSAPKSQVVFYRVNCLNEKGEEIPSSSVTAVSTSDTPEATQPDSVLAYNKNDIITDSQLTNVSTMSASQIQSFLASQGSVLANYSTGGKSAAQHIYDNCQTHGISPYVVLVTLQKEKSLIKSSTANPNSFAMGWNTGDSTTSDFASQIYYGTRQFRRYYDNLGSYSWTVGQSHAVSDGSVTAANTATAGLYVYTPWIGQGGGGQSGVGGNYLFWDLWYNTFSFDGGNTPASCGSQPTSFYLRFPLQGSTAYSRLINSVMDHSMTTLYGTDNNVTGFSGEIGLAQYGGSSGGYKNSPGIDFFLNSAYRGANSQPAFLNYDGHPGIDYHAGCGTSVYAAVSGTVHYPASITGISNGATYHILEIVPDPPNDNYRVYYLHLSTYKNITTTVPCVDEPQVVSDGTHVNAGTSLIGKVGRKGTGVEHLHFEVHKNVNGTFTPVDPYGWQGQYQDPRGAGSNTNLWKPKGYASCSVRWHPDGTLVTADGNTVYLIQNGQKRGIATTSVFYAYGFDFANVINISPEEFGCIPDGPGLGSPPSSRLRSVSGTIYEVTDRNFKRAFPSEKIFQGQGFRWSDVQSGSVAGIADDPNIPIYNSPFREGTLVQVSGNPSVYIISNSKKRLFGSSSAFTSLGYRFEDVIVTDSATVSSIPSGDPITDSLITTCNSGGGGVPNAPSYSSVTAVSSNDINVFWNDNSSNEDGFKIERKVGAGGTYAQVSTVGSNTIAYQDHGLTANTTYFYRVRAYNSAGNSAYSGEGSATTQPSRTLTVLSSNPNSGVGISALPTDINGFGGGTTTFTRTYNNNTDVTLTAPTTASGNNFQKWQRDGVDAGTNLQTTVAMDANHTMTAVYMPVVTRTLTVSSSNPGSGVTITVTPNDNSSQGNGTTQFTRVYNNNASVTLTAPATAAGNNFQKWQRDGVDVGTNVQTTVTMDANRTMTAVYSTPLSTRTLTVASSNPGSGVSVTVTPNDNNGQGSGATQFTRLYANNTIVGLSAPATAGGNSFQKWQRDGSDWTTSMSTSVTMDANHTMTAVYASCAAPGAFSLISPADGVNLAATSSVTLSWGSSPNATSYDVSFGPSSNPNFWGTVTGTSLNVSVNVGQTYWWKVVARVNCSSSLTFATTIWSFSVNSVTPPNNNFANAQSITGTSGTVNGSNAGATKEPGEPNHANNAGGASIWYFWSAPADGYVTMTTVGSNFDTLLAVYTNSTLTSLTPIAGNDDINSGNQASSVTFNTTAGTVYRIAVDGWAGAMGNTTLNWNFIPDTNRINVALAANGGVATASTTTPADGTGTFFPSVTIDGDHKGLNTSFWRDGTGDTYPDWLEVDFAGSKTIHEIDVYTLQDNYTNPVEPSLNMSFNLYGITEFNVQYWSDFWGWVNVPGGSVTGNTSVWRRFTFADIETTKVRVLVNNALASRSRIVELEAYGVMAPTSAVNVALASNGGVATASSTTPPDGTGIFFPSVTVDGDRKGLNTSFWRDGTGDSYPDWLQVDFAGSKTINEIDVYTLQDNYTNPVEPTAGMTFNQYGITAFEVQSWNGSSWETVPGGSVIGNNNVWRKFTFASITTSKIRVLINNALASRSRLVELEAYSSTALPPNVALASNGGVATASSTTPPDGTGIFFPSVTVDGDRKGLNTSFWRDGTGDSYPDWLQVDFAGSKTINEIDVYTLQDNYTNPVEPTAAMTFNLYGITAFEVQYWTGSSWLTVPGGSVVGNNNVWRKFTFASITTTKIRVLVNNALASRSRIVELEAY